MFNTEWSVYVYRILTPHVINHLMLFRTCLLTLRPSLLGPVNAHAHTKQPISQSGDIRGEHEDATRGV